MKNLIKRSMVIAIASIVMFSNPLKAQDVTKEMDIYARKFEDAFNKKDSKAIQKMFTADAVKTEEDGTVETGADVITAKLVDFMNSGTVTLTISQSKATKNADGTVTGVGTYHVTGTMTNGSPLDVMGAYNNTVVNDHGDWKISKQVLSKP